MNRGRRKDNRIHIVISRVVETTIGIYNRSAIDQATHHNRGNIIQILTVAFYPIRILPGISSSYPVDFYHEFGRSISSIRRNVVASYNEKNKDFWMKGREETICMIFKCDLVVMNGHLSLCEFALLGPVIFYESL